MNILDLILTTDITICPYIIAINPLEYENHCSDYVPSDNTRSIYRFPILLIHNYLNSDNTCMQIELCYIDGQSLIEPAIYSYAMLSILIDTHLLVCNNHTSSSHFSRFSYPIHLKACKLVQVSAQM